MSEMTISGPQLFRVSDGPVAVPGNSSNSTTEQEAFGLSSGGSTYLTCAITVNDPGDDDHAYGGVESSWAFLVKSPGPSPLMLRVRFGTLSLRAFGSRHNEWGWSSHEVYAGLYPFARVLHPEVRDLTPNPQRPVLDFWNIDLGPQNEASMRRLVGNHSEDTGLNMSRWDRTLLAFPNAFTFRYAPSNAITQGEFVAFIVGFRLMVSAPEVDDYDFRLSTESSATISWVNLESVA
ncbi:hypothetical protein [Streptomyces sp. ISL-86]|uniref:hypothetical protein n=1 Tax=Streptomyces sp. ISL-86 TaxID=2819187 RepID=UPI001BE9511E|nr:hypothetical protein [Streptomyces sp. ISL-86]MBT2459918.1 hypothetical protein [Streptomyces sp. ISL-86]